MAKGYFIVRATPDNKDISFNPSSEATGDTPQEQQDLIFSVGAVLEVVRTLYAMDAKSFANYFDQLLQLSQLGLVGENCQPQLAKRALEQIKSEITNRESGKVKNKYLKELGFKALWLGIGPLLLGTLFNYYYCGGKVNLGCLNCPYLGNMFLLWTGCMIGVWLSFAITKTIIGFDDLTILEKDRLEPAIRLLFTGTLSIIFGLLFIKKAIVISLGSLSSNNISTDPVVAFLIGVILGLNEKIIGSSLTKKTAGLFEK